MKAIILVGGYGTRMRPLTINCPKSVLPFVNRPMVELQVEALAKVGVREIILAINYGGEIIQGDLLQVEHKYGVKLIYSKQPEALGTAGPIKFCRETILKDNPEGMVFVFNSDIVCDFPLSEMLENHRSHGKQATIVLATVEDPSRFGVVVTNQSQRIERFVEKPKEFISNKINAGIYLLNVKVIDRIPDRFCMIEKEIFPQLAQEGQLQAYPLKNNFWFDLGKPEDYLLGQKAYLQYYGLKGKNCEGHCLVDPSAEIGPDCRIGPNVVIGPNCRIGPGSRLRDCAIFANTIVGVGCLITNSIISKKCSIGGWARIEQMTSISEEVKVSEEVRLAQTKVLSNISVTGSHSNAVLM